MFRVITTYIQKFFSPQVPVNVGKATQSLGLLTEIIKIESFIFFDKKHKHQIVKLVDALVLRAHHLQQKITLNKEQNEHLNAIKLVVIELVNVYVDDMLKVIQTMSDKSKQMLSEVIENLESQPPVQKSLSKIQTHRVNRQGSQNVLQSSGSTIMHSASTSSIVYDKQEDQYISGRHFQQNPSSNLAYNSAQPISQIAKPSPEQINSQYNEEDLSKLLIINLQEGLTRLGQMTRSNFYFQDLNKIILLVIRSMFQLGMHGTDIDRINQMFNVLNSICEHQQTFPSIQQMIPQILNAFLQLPLLNKYIEQLLFKVVYIEAKDGSQEEDMMKTLTYFINKRNQFYSVAILRILLVYLLKPGIAQKSFSKESLEQLVDAVINLCVIFGPKEPEIKSLGQEVFITILSNIEEQMESRITGQFPDPSYDQKILHKVKFKLVPFLDSKQNLIVLSNGDFVKLPDNIFQGIQQKHTIENKNIKTFDEIVKKNDFNHHRYVRRMSQEEIQLNQYNVRASDNLFTAQYSKDQVQERGPPHYRMKQQKNTVMKKYTHGNPYSDDPFLYTD